MAHCPLPRASLSSILLLVSVSMLLHAANATVNVFDEEECHFPALFAFGDSLTDTGNAQAVFPWQHAASLPPYGDTYFGEPRDRFSDGRLLIDFFGECLLVSMFESGQE